MKLSLVRPLHSPRARIFRWSLRVAELCLFLLGLVGLPTDLSQLGDWLTALGSNVARWLFVVVALALVIVSEVLIPRLNRVDPDERVLNAARLVLAEFEGLKEAYSDDDTGTSDSSLAEARARLRAAMDHYIRAASPMGDAEQRLFHTSQGHSLLEALELEIQKYPMGLVAFEEPISHLAGWLTSREQEAERCRLRQVVEDQAS